MSRKTSKQPSTRRLGVLIIGTSLLVAGGVATGVALSELTLTALYTHPTLIPRHPPQLLRFFRELYGLERHVVQEELESVRYDPGIFYTLRPGRFVFSNIEFSTPYRVNSLGTRDDESALDRPEIVVIGDSFAMGWGVAQEQTFAKLLEKKTGKRVLDAAVASYGTVREMMMLDRVDRRRMKTLVIQYCENDYDENDAFLAGGNHYAPGPESKLLYAIAQHRKDQQHAFLRYTRMAIWNLRKRIAAWREGRDFDSQPDDMPLAETVARRFLNALAHAHHADLSHTRVIVFDPDPNPGFIRAVARLHTEEKYPRYVREMTVLDLSAQFTPDRYFILDDHLNESGHQMIADEVLKVL